MAGLKLKSGADFCNFEAFRMRLHNAGEDPTSDFGVGQIYFNTSDTSVGSARHVRLYDGTKFRSLAYLDDVDSRIKTIEDMLSVDTAEGVVSTWNEIQAFLDSVQEGTDLMDLLNDKLNTSGGTINGNTSTPLIINTSNSKEVGVRLSMLNNPLAWIGYTSTYGVYLYLYEGMRRLGIKDDGTPYYYSGAEFPLLHSGNIGKYKAGDSDKLGGVSASSYVAAKTISGDLNATDLYSSQSFVLSLNSSAQNVPSGMNSGEGIYIAGYDTGFMLLSSYTQDKLLYRRGSNSLGSNSILSHDWKTIAFTDSDITGTANKAKALVSLDGKSVAYVADNNTFYIGDSIYPTTSTQILGKDIRLRYGANASFGFWLNESGNVTIGGSDLAGTGAKLYVDGDIHLGIAKLCSIGAPYSSSDPILFNRISISNTTDGIKYYSGGWTYNASNISHEFIVGINNKSALAITNSGNILIGTTTDTGERLQVDGDIAIAEKGTSLIFKDMAYLKSYGNKRFLIHNKNGLFLGYETPDQDTEIYGKTIRLYAHTTINGDLHVTGNIIADGEISGGGRAEEGGTIGGEGVAEKVTATIEVGLKFKEISHTLGDNVIVQVYEWNANSQTWDMVLTDVETTTNLVTVRFGNETDVPHKVVII